MSDEPITSPDPALPPETAESPAHPFDGAAMAKLRWEKPGSSSLDTVDGQIAALKTVARSGLREIRRVQRAGKPLPALLISATSRPLEFLLSDSLARGDLAEARKLLATAKRRRA